MFASALAHAAAFLLSVGITATFVWRLLDDLIGEVRPIRAYAVGPTVPCWRCRKVIDGADGQCPRCRATLRHTSVRVERTEARFAIGAQIHYGNYLEWVIDTPDQVRLTVVAPQGPVVRAGDQLDLVFDRRRRLRELNNLSLGSGWRLPVRVIGRRSPLAVVGLMIAIPCSTLLILLAPMFFFYQAVVQSFAQVSDLLADHVDHVPEPAIGSAWVVAIVLYLVGAIVFGGLVTLARTRPRVNRALGAQ